jgi:hypothetical protein
LLFQAVCTIWFSGWTGVRRLPGRAARRAGPLVIRNQPRPTVVDLTLLALSIGFFVAAIWYAFACDHL